MSEKSPLDHIDKTERRIKYNQAFLSNENGIRDEYEREQFEMFFESSKKHFQKFGLDLWSKDFVDKYTDKPIKILNEIIWKIVKEETDRYVKSLRDNLSKRKRSDIPMAVRDDEGTAQFYWYYGINYFDCRDNPRACCVALEKAIAQQEESA